eukprot:4869376-Amphidinium_carterae.1
MGSSMNCGDKHDCKASLSVASSCSLEALLLFHELDSDGNGILTCGELAALRRDRVLWGKRKAIYTIEQARPRALQSHESAALYGSKIRMKRFVMSRTLSLPTATTCQRPHILSSLARCQIRSKATKYTYACMIDWTQKLTVSLTFCCDLFWLSQRRQASNNSLPSFGWSGA